MEHTGANVDNIKSVETTFAIVDLLKGSKGAGVTELAAQTGLAKSTVHNHVTTLKNLGYVTHEEGVYRLSWRFLELGEQVRNTHPQYRVMAEHVENLAARFEERAQFIVEENGEGVYLYRKTGPRAVRTDSRVGKRIYLHSTAAGKAILANLPEHRLHEIIDQHGLPSVTPHTVTDVEELFAELADIRDRGFAFNREENLERLNAVGVPVMAPDGGVLGALSVSGPSHRMDGETFTTELPGFMLGLANEIELNLAYPR